MSLSKKELERTYEVVDYIGSVLSQLTMAATISKAFLCSKDETEKSKTFGLVDTLLTVCCQKLYKIKPAEDGQDRSDMLDTLLIVSSEDIVLLGIEAAQTTADGLSNPKITKPKVEGDLREEISNKYREYVDFCMKWKNEIDALMAASVKAINDAGKGSSDSNG